MSYLDRLRQCAYKSPSGSQFVLQFDDVERSGSKKAAIHELPQQSKPDIQDLGNNAYRFTLQAYFTGADYDQEADAFCKSLEEKGAGGLQHPRWGDIAVLPLTWSQSESFVEGMGRANFSVEFIYAPDTVAFPLTAIEQQTTILNAADKATLDLREAFSLDFLPVDAEDVAACVQTVLDVVQDITDQFAAITNGIDEATREIENQISTIESTIDDLVAAPGQLFDAIEGLYNTVSGIPGKIADKLESYAAQIDNLFDRLSPEKSPQTMPTTKAQATLLTTIASIATASAATATATGTTASRQEAVRNAEQVDSIRETHQEIIEGTEEAVATYQETHASAGAFPVFVADLESIAAVAAVASQAAAIARKASFDLRSERKYKVPADMPALVLLWQFYQSIDALDEFIKTNDLQGNEILMVPAGREVVYYVG